MDREQFRSPGHRAYRSRQEISRRCGCMDRAAADDTNALGELRQVEPTSTMATARYKKTVEKIAFTKARCLLLITVTGGHTLTPS